MMKSLQQPVRSLALVIAFLVLPACHSDQDIPLRLGSNVWLGYELFYVARDAGFYNGENIELVEFRSAAQVIHALQSGAINAAGLTLDEALQVIDAGVDVQVVSVLDYSNGADALVVSPQITEPEQLRGKRVALENSTVGGYLLHRFLQTVNMDVDDVTIVPTANLEQEALMARHGADAVVTFDPVRSRLIERGYRVLFSSAQIPGEIADVLVVLDGERAPSPAAIHRLLEGFYKARGMLSDNPVRFDGFAQRRMKIPARDIEAGFDEVVIPYPHEVTQMMQPGGDVEQQVIRLGVYLSDIGRIAGACTCSNLVNDRYISDISETGAVQ